VTYKFENDTTFDLLNSWNLIGFIDKDLKQDSYRLELINNHNGGGINFLSSPSDSKVNGAAVPEYDGYFECGIAYGMQFCQWGLYLQRKSNKNS
jgi:hypothetical protein